MLPAARSLCLCLALLVLGRSRARAQDAGATIQSGPRLDKPSSTGSVLRTAPQLVEKPDGSYAFTGNGFDATIDREGTIHMRDHFARSRLLFKPNQLADGQWVITFWEIKFDLFAWLEKKFGNDPFRSERRWFLDGTRDLRAQLATQAVVANMRNVLNAIWSKAGINFAERKRRTFAVWDESSEDEFGELCRAQVLAFVRERCPHDSPLGFDERELGVLNKTRRSRTLFAPYAAP